MEMSVAIGTLNTTRMSNNGWTFQLSNPLIVAQVIVDCQCVQWSVGWLQIIVLLFPVKQFKYSWEIPYSILHTDSLNEFTCRFQMVMNKEVNGCQFLSGRYYNWSIKSRNMLCGRLTSWLTFSDYYIVSETGGNLSSNVVQFEFVVSQRTLTRTRTSHVSCALFRFSSRPEFVLSKAECDTVWGNGNTCTMTLSLKLLYLALTQTLFVCCLYAWTSTQNVHIHENMCEGENLGWS